jgi:hypothetical protein
MSWPLLISVVAIVSIVAVYFVWVRKPEAKQDQQQQPQA